MKTIKKENHRAIPIIVFWNGIIVISGRRLKRKLIFETRNVLRKK